MNFRREQVLRHVMMVWGFGALSACGGAGTQPTDMSAEEHRRAADEEAELAREHNNEDPQVVSGASAINSGGASRVDIFGESVYNPVAVHEELSARHRELAAAHRAAARSLESYEEHECGAFPAATRAVCPLLGQIISVEEIDSGSRATFGPDVNADAAAAHVACHLAYAQTEGREGMSECPLYLDDVRTMRSGPSTIDFVTDGDVSELRRRLAAHVTAE